MVKTVIFSSEEGLQMVYHNTRVCLKKIKGIDNKGEKTLIISEITLNHEGWKTPTTKKRFNQFSDLHCSNKYYVYQENFEWFIQISKPGVPWEDTWKNEPIHMEDSKITFEIMEEI